jgi:PhnB protein
MMQVFSPKSPGGGASISYMFVPNVDDVFNNAVSAGATVIMPLMDAFWGDRCGSIIDPFGHRWTLATHKKDISDEEMEKASKEMGLKITEKH